MLVNQYEASRVSIEGVPPGAPGESVDASEDQATLSGGEWRDGAFQSDSAGAWEQEMPPEDVEAAGEAVKEDQAVDNHERLHNALGYLRPVDYYRGNPEAMRKSVGSDGPGQAPTQRDQPWTETEKLTLGNLIRFSKETTSSVPLWI